MNLMRSLVNWLVCVPLGMFNVCYGFSLLAPATNEIASMSASSGHLKWKTTLPFKTNSRISICGDRLRIVSVPEGTEPSRIQWLDAETGQLLRQQIEDCSMPSGKSYRTSEYGGEFFQDHWRLKEDVMMGEKLEFLDSFGIAGPSSGAESVMRSSLMRTFSSWVLIAVTVALYCQPI